MLEALREWQVEGGPIQLHPGDVGWFRRFGDEAADAAVRELSGAVGLLDGARVLRLAIAPEARRDASTARRLASEVNDVLPAGEGDVEAPADAALRELLLQAGWSEGEPWTGLRRDLREPVEDPGLRIEVAGPEQVEVRTEVHRASFERSTFTEAHWHAMAAGPAYADARCLVAYDGEGAAVAATTVWSAGPGRPGLLEPLGVHRDHRGRGHGRAITLAAARALRELGSSSASVCTPSANAGAVATYKAGGFRVLGEVRDLHRT